MMAELSAATTVSANRGQLVESTNESMRVRFTSVFERFDYTEYHDLVMPIIEIASSGDLGWIAVNVRAVGNENASGNTFDNQWAWVMMVEKINGAWRSTGNASNSLQ
jgi:hypothetical protein